MKLVLLHYSCSTSIIVCCCKLFIPQTPRLRSLLLAQTSRVCSSNLITSLRNENSILTLKPKQSNTCKGGCVIGFFFRNQLLGAQRERESRHMIYYLCFSGVKQDSATTRTTEDEISCEQPAVHPTYLLLTLRKVTLSVAFSVFCR